MAGGRVESLEARVMLAAAGDVPRVIGIEYDAGAPIPVAPVKYLLARFNADVGSTLALEDVRVHNVSAGVDVAPASLTWDGNSKSAVIAFPSGALAEGNYTLTLAAAGIADANGTPLDGDDDGNPGGNFSRWFSEFAGDANGDHTVNFNDLLALAKNYNATTGASRPQGDFNSDRQVNFADLLALAKNYNRSLAPSIRVVAPAGGQVSGVVDLVADPSDDHGLAGVQFLVNGAPVGAEDTAAPYSLPWDSTAVPNGTYPITAVARGSDGVSVTSEATGVTVNNADTTAPTVSLTAPAAAATLHGVVTLSASASDNVGVVGVQFLVDGVAVGAEDVAAPFSITWDSKAVGDGPHTITARARDAAGNTTVTGPRGVTVANTGAAASGQWSGVMDWPLVAINTVMLKDGRILMWDGDGTGDVCIGPTSARVWNPSTGEFTPVPIPYFTGQEDDIFCSAQTLLADGRVLVVGGHDCDGPGLGIAMSNLFDPATMTWMRGPDMHYRRWYPTATTLADGRVIVLGGSVETTVDYVSIPEVYDPVTNTFTELEDAELSIPSYSFVFQHPDGRVIVTGSDEAKMPTYALNVATQTWSVVDPTVLDAGSGVMYRPGQFLKAGSSYLSAPLDNGGSVPSTATTYVLDTTSPGTPRWQQTASMANARTHLNLTLLPDGSVLATGGSQDIGGLTPSKAVYPAELWSPTTRTWTTMASMKTPRMYHSTAILLPDGRVLIAGGGRLGPVSYPSAEIYSPPYLFHGARPVITAAPASVEYGSDFFVATPDTARIASVTLMGSGAVTHSFNMNQRNVPLTFDVVNGGLRVHAPADERLATPGHYMLFIVDANGVPSVAPFVRLPAPYEDLQPPTAPANPSGTGAVGKATLSWTAATDNRGVVRYNVYRSTTPGFVPAPANLLGTSGTTGFTDFAPAGTYHYVIRAVDLAGNIGPGSPEVAVTILADTTPPTVAITAPTGGANVSGLVTLTAGATDDVSVAGVRFLIDGVPVGSEDTAAPYSFAWNSRQVANGSHRLTAVARDGAGNTTTAPAVTFTVANVNGLVASYAFGDGAAAAAAVASDSSGNGLNGQISGATWTSAGRFGGALSFDGVNDIVDVADANALDLTTGMTLEAWVRPTALSGYRTVVMKDVPDELAYALYASGDVNRPSSWARVGSTSYDATGSAALTLNTWTHLASTYDGTTLRLFVNGVQVASRTVSGSLQTSNNPLHIGGNAVWGEYFAGLIDDVRIYNRPLAAAEIQVDMNTPVAADAAALAPLAAGVPAAAAAPTLAASSGSSTAVAITRSAPVRPKPADPRRNAAVFNVSVPIDRRRKTPRIAVESVLA
jgi:hypothetical protein